MFEDLLILLSFGRWHRELFKIFWQSSYLQVREENPILYSHKIRLNIKLSLLQHYNNMFRSKLSAIFRSYMKPI